MTAPPDHYDVWVYLLVAAVVYACVLVPCRMQVWVTSVSLFELFCYIFQRSFSAYEYFFTPITLFGAAVLFAAICTCCGICLVCYLAACQNRPALLLSFLFNTAVSSLFLVAGASALGEPGTSDVIGSAFPHTIQIVGLVLAFAVRCLLGWAVARVSPRCGYRYGYRRLGGDSDDDDDDGYDNSSSRGG